VIVKSQHENKIEAVKMVQHVGGGASKQGRARCRSESDVEVLTPPPEVAVQPFSGRRLGQTGDAAARVLPAGVAEIKVDRRERTIPQALRDRGLPRTRTTSEQNGHHVWKPSHLDHIPQVVSLDGAPRGLPQADPPPGLRRWARTSSPNPSVSVQLVWGISSRTAVDEVTERLCSGSCSLVDRQPGQVHLADCGCGVFHGVIQGWLFPPRRNMIAKDAVWVGRTEHSLG